MAGSARGLGSTLETEPDTRGGVTIHIDARLDRLAQIRLRHRVDKALAGRPSRLVLDLSGVEFLDGFGIGALVLALGNAMRRDVPVVVRDPSPAIRRSMEQRGLLGLVDVETAVGDRCLPAVQRG
jgi:anti-anti-sigma factor